MTDRNIGMHATPRQQQGATLVVGLLILLVMTLIALAGMNSSTMQEKMAANAQNNNRTFQAAESAVSALTTAILGGTQTSLTAAMNSPSSLSSATTYNVGDAQISANYQVEYLGEIILTSGDSIDANTSSTQLKGYRFDLIGTSSISGANAGSTIHQGIEYH